MGGHEPGRRPHARISAPGRRRDRVRPGSMRQELGAGDRAGGPRRLPRVGSWRSDVAERRRRAAVCARGDGRLGAAWRRHLRRRGDGRPRAAGPRPGPARDGHAARREQGPGGPHHDGRADPAWRRRRTARRGRAGATPRGSRSAPRSRPDDTSAVRGEDVQRGHGPARERTEPAAPGRRPGRRRRPRRPGGRRSARASRCSSPATRCCRPGSPPPGRAHPRRERTDAARARGARDGGVVASVRVRRGRTRRRSTRP